MLLKCRASNCALARAERSYNTYDRAGIDATCVGEARTPNAPMRYPHRGKGPRCRPATAGPGFGALDQALSNSL